MKRFNEKGFNRAVIKYEYLVKLILTQYTINHDDYDDALQEGRIGLYKAVKAYSFDKGCTFVTFASLCIKRQIISFLRLHGNKNYKINKMQLPIEFIDMEHNKESYYDNSLEKVIYLKNNYEEAYHSVLKQIKPIEKKVYGNYIIGYTINELSENYNIPKKKIYSIIAKTKKKIEAKMNQI